MSKTWDNVKEGFNQGPWLARNIAPLFYYAKCPDCGGLMIDDGLCYTSNPPQYKFECQQCGRVAWSYELLKGVEQ